MFIHEQTSEVVAHLMKRGMQHYLHTWRHTILLITLFWMIHALLSRWLPLPHFQWLTITVDVVIALAGLFLLSAALYRANAIIEGKPVGLRISCDKIKQRALLLISAAFILALLAAGLLYLALQLIQHFAENSSVIVTLFILSMLGLAVVMALLYCFFVLPLITVSQCNLLTAFAHSAVCVKENWKEAFVLYCLSALIIFLIAPATKHSAWLMQYDLFDVFELIVLVGLLPLLMNMTLITLHDAQKTQQQEQKED